MHCRLLVHLYPAALASHPHAVPPFPRYSVHDELSPVYPSLDCSHPADEDADPHYGVSSSTIVSTTQDPTLFFLVSAKLGFPAKIEDCNNLAAYQGYLRRGRGRSPNFFVFLRGTGGGGGFVLFSLLKFYTAPILASTHGDTERSMEGNSGKRRV